MRVLIDVGHPAHVHLFKNAARIMRRRGHDVLFTARDKEITEYLLDTFDLEYRSLGSPYTGQVGKVWGLAKFNYLLLQIARRFRPDILVSHGSMYAAHVAFLLGKPHIALEDTGNMEQVRLYRPFSDVILTPSSIHRALGTKQLRYEGYHELAYLHPNYFEPDPLILHQLGVEEKDRYVVLRFVAWNATHDRGNTGLTLENKRRAVDVLSKYARVFISAEGRLPEDLEGFRITVPPECMHDVLAQAALLYGESATMASECAMLGTPAIYTNALMGTTEEQANRYGLIRTFSVDEEDQRASIDAAVRLLEDSDLKERWMRKRQRMLQEKIDVTAFLVWFIEAFPESATIMREFPEHQYRFQGVGEKAPQRRS